MNFKIIAATLVLVSAGYAQAEPLKVLVSTTGKSPSALKADLMGASRAVCRAAQEPLDAPGDLDRCVDATYRWTQTQVRRAGVFAAPRRGVIASR